MLLQGTVLPKQVHLAREALPEVRNLPAAHTEHGHEAMVFEEPENQEGESTIRKRTSARSVAANWPAWSWPTPPPGSYPPAPPSTFPPSGLYSPYPNYPPAPPHLPFPFPGSYFPFPYCPPPPQPSPGSNQPPPQFQAAANQPQQPCSLTEPRQRAWRRQKRAEEDAERVARGEPPRKSTTKDHYHYTCKDCGKAKCKTTGHTQLKGRWYCPASGLSLEQWRETLSG